MYDKNSNLYNGKTENWVALKNISPYLIQATISIEDKKFYQHKGFDFLRIMKALMTNVSVGKRKEGASTISQQYVKNLFLSFDKTWERKIDEAWLTLRLETHYSKDEILEGYLNTINYGGVYGIENASKYYFNKSAKDLTLAEASMLSGIPKSPANYSPIKNPKQSKERQAIILEAMVKNNYITEKEKNDTLKEELTYTGTLNESELNTTMYYQDAVIKELKSLNSIPESFLTTGGLKVYTTLDTKAQDIIEESIKNNIKDINSLETAIVLMNPNNGEILGIAGGKDYNESEYNRVTDSKRQVGSTMKPFLYYTALENGFTASTTFNSTKTTFVFSDEKTYSPENFGKIYPNKPISLAAALAFSDNIYAVKTHLFLGEDNLVEFAKRLGISDNLNTIPSLALGTEEINILNMMQGYATFANMGYKVKPHFIKKVEDMKGNVLYEFKDDKESILNKSNVYILNELLTGCYNKNFISYTYPTCYSIASKMTRKYAIKTGSTDTDGWIFGYNPDVLLGTWTGYDDNKVTSSDDTNALKNLWIDIMEKYLEGKEETWYEKPNNVISTLVEPISGQLATKDTKNATLFYYIKGSEPNNETNNLDDSMDVWKEIKE